MPVTSHTHLIFLLTGFKEEPAGASGLGQAHSHKREQAHWPLTSQIESFQPGVNVAIQSARDEGTALLDSPLWNLQSSHVWGGSPPQVDGVTPLLIQ